MNLVIEIFPEKLYYLGFFFSKGPPFEQKSCLSLSLSIDVILSLTKQQRLDVQRYRHSTCVAQQSAFPCSKVVVCIEKPMDSVVVDECCFLKSKDLRYIEPYS